MKRLKHVKQDKRSGYYKRKRINYKGSKRDKEVGDIMSSPSGLAFDWFECRCSKVINDRKLPRKKRSRMKYEPEELYYAACEYFSFVESHPLYERKIVGHYKGEPMMVDIPKRRVMTINGMLLFLELSCISWYNHYKKKERYEHIVSFIEMIIHEQKFTGAASGFFKENLIMRDLGMVDKRDTTSGGRPISSPVQINATNVKEAEKAYKQLLMNK